MEKEDYLKIVEENQNLRKTIEFYQTQEKALRQELLRERLWRIDFQISYLKDLSERTKAELEELEKPDGPQAEGAVHIQD
jgi:hypothetical protein